MQAKEIKPGAVVNYQGAPILIETITVQSPSAQGAATLYKFRGRNLVTKQKIDITLKGGDVLDAADFGRREVKLMYCDATHVHLLDQGDYNQYSLPAGGTGSRVGVLTTELEGVLARSTTANASACSCPLPSNLRSPNAIRAREATRPPAAPNPPRWRRASSSRSRNV